MPRQFSEEHLSEDKNNKAAENNKGSVKCPGRDYVEYLNLFFERVGAWSFDHRWLVIFSCLLLFAASLFLASRAHIDMTFAAFFEEKDPTYAAYQQYREDFGSDEMSYILYEVPEKADGPFDLEVMRKIAQLTLSLEKEVPFVSKVTSLANVEIMQAVPDGIAIHELLEEFPETQEELSAIRQMVLGKPLLVGGVVSQDAKFAAIIVEMEKSSVDPPEDLMLDPEGSSWIDNLYPQVSDAKIDEILARPEYAGITFYHAGDVPWNAKYNRIMMPQTVTLTMITYCIIGILLFVFFRRFTAVIGPFIVVTIAITVAAGVIGLMGWNLDFMFPFIPNLLIAIGIADSVHIISEFNIHYRKLGDRREAIKRTMYHVGTPCLLTSLTTAAGVLAMSASHIESLAHMAIYSAAGILAAFLFSVTLLMTLFAFGKRKYEPKVSKTSGLQTKKSKAFDALLLGVADFDIKHPVLIIMLSAVVFASSIAGMTRLHIDNDFMAEWKEDEPIRNITMKVDEEMGGMSSVIYLFDTGKADGIKEPAVLREIERIQLMADQQTPFVKKSYSIVDVIKELNRTFHNDDPAYYRIPDSRELVAQLLLVYEMSGGEELGQYVSSDLSRANLELRCRMEAVSKMVALAEHIDAEIQANPLEFTKTEITGIGALWVQFAEYIADSQIKGILLAFGVIAVMMCIIFKSINIGLLSMIPNITPVLFTLGYMGWVGMELDYTRLLIAPLAIGIAVDDTIHMVTRFHVEFRRLGNYAQALRACMLDVGRALTGTTVILMAGFIVNVFHGMETQVIFGQLVAWTIFLALVADFFLLPALILVVKPFGPERRPGNEKMGEAIQQYA
jgi:hypothetical protein